MKRARALAAAALVFGPPAAALGYIAIYGINAAHWDHLTNAELFDRYYRGTLSSEFLLRPHLEHIKLFPRLIWLALGIPSRFNNLVEQYAQWAVLGATAVMLFAAARRRTGTPAIAFAWQFVPVSLLLFSVRQHEALLVGDGLIAYLTTAAGIFALARLDRPGFAAVVAAAAAVFVASFSHANGFVFWPIGALLLIASRERPEWRGLWIWTVAAGGAIALYVAHWPQTASNSLGFALANPLETIVFAFAAAGTPFGQQPALQIVFGLAALALQGAALAIAYRAWRRGDRLPFGASLILFALGVQALIAIGRTADDAGVGIASRYAVFIALGMSGAYLTALERARADRTGHRLVRASAILILIGSIPGYAEGIDAGPRERDGRLRAAQVLRSVPQQTDAAIERLLYPSAADGRRFAAMLEHWRLNVFAGQPCATPTRAGAVAAAHFLDQVNFDLVRPGAAYEVTSGDSVGVEGWAFDQQTWRPFACGYVRIDPSGVRIPLAYGLDRPGVRTHYKLPRGSATGYTVIFSAAQLTPGENVLSLELVARGGTRLVTVPRLVTITRR